MRLLRLVGPSADGGALVVETADGGEQFTLPINERLRNVSTSDLPRLPVPDSAAGDAPSPREIQTRVRAGASAQEVADEAGIPLDRVMRFAFPVVQERIRVVDEARRARARSSHEGQLTDFGSLVDGRFSEHGVDPAEVSWDAYRRADGGWTVTAALTAHEQPLLAKFSFALVNRTVSALDALAADLLSDRPVQALLPPMPTPVMAEPEPVDRTAPPRLAAVPDPDEPAEDPSVGESTISPPPSSAIRPGRRQKAHTRPIPVSDDDELFDQDAFDPNAVEPAFRHSAPDQQDRPVDPIRGPLGRPAGRGQHARDWQDAALPLELDADLPGPDGTEEPDGDGRGRRNRRGDKPRMPSWDDILLGVRHKSE